MFPDSDEVLDLSRQCCWPGSKDADAPCIRGKLHPDDPIQISDPSWPLCRLKPSAHEAYRLVVRPSFNGNEVFCVAFDNEMGDFWWEASETFLQKKSSRRLAMSKSRFVPLFAALEAVEFWSSPSMPDDRVGLDGHYSTFEGIRGDAYRRLTRWSPEGPLADLEKAFTDLAGVKPGWR